MDDYIVKINISCRLPQTTALFHIGLTCYSPFHPNHGIIIKSAFGIGFDSGSRFVGFAKIINFGFRPDLEHYRFLYRVYPWLSLLLPKSWYIDAEKFYQHEQDPNNNSPVRTFAMWR